MKVPANILGEGQFSKVFKVRRWHDGQFVSAKIFKMTKCCMTEEMISVADREIAVLKSLESHPMII